MQPILYFQPTIFGKLKKPVYPVNSDSVAFSHPVMLILDSACEFTKEHMVGNLVRRLFVMRDTQAGCRADRRLAQLRPSAQL